MLKLITSWMCCEIHSPPQPNNPKPCPGHDAILEKLVTLLFSNLILLSSCSVSYHDLRPVRNYMNLFFFEESNYVSLPALRQNNSNHHHPRAFQLSILLISWIFF